MTRTEGELPRDLNEEDRTSEAIRRLQRRCWQISEDHGWHPNYSPEIRAHLGGDRVNGVNVIEKLHLIMGEVSEATEVLRDAKRFPSLVKTYEILPSGEVREYREPEDGEAPAKPEGFGSELADVIIRTFDLAGAIGVDLGVEIPRKMRYNQTRPYRHGGKTA